MSEPAILRGIKYANQDEGDPRFWLVHFEVDGGVLFQNGRSECVLEVLGYDPESRAASIVTVRLSRTGHPQTIWYGKVSSLHVPGAPELVWGSIVADEKISKPTGVEVSPDGKDNR